MWMDIEALCLQCECHPAQLAVTDWLWVFTVVTCTLVCSSPVHRPALLSQASPNPVTFLPGQAHFAEWPCRFSLNFSTSRILRLIVGWHGTNLFHVKNTHTGWKFLIFRSSHKRNISTEPLNFRFGRISEFKKIFIQCVFNSIWPDPAAGLLMCLPGLAWLGLAWPACVVCTCLSGLHGQHWITSTVTLVCCVAGSARNCVL